MPKISALLLSVVLLSLLPLTAAAQTTTGAASGTDGQTQTITNDKTEAARRINNIAKTDLRQQIKDRVAAKREAIRETVAAKREAFRLKLLEIKDQKKQILVERIDAKLTRVNTKHTDRFAQVLENLQAILDKTSNDLNKTAAQAAIDAAKLAVENQAAKTYSITLSTETALRLDVGKVTSQLRLDLVAVHKLVVDAKQAVQALKKDNALIRKNATDSANL